MYKYFSILLITILFNIAGTKAEVNRDSIGIENLKGKKLIIHRIVAHDTYYSLARRYNVSPKDIMSYNDNKYLQLGVIIKVPTLRDFNETVGPKATPSTEQATTNNTDVLEIDYTVKRKDNLNRLAEKYGTTVNDIKSLNNLNSINLRVGQVLKIPAKPGTVSTEDSTVASSTTTTQTPASPIEQKPKYTTAPTKAPVQQPISVPQNSPDADEPLVVHTVASNETIYSIATTYHLTMDQLKAKNNLTTNGLHVGQRLLIKGHYPTVPVQRPSEPLSSGDTTLRDPSLRGAPSKYGLNQVDEKGTAIWITDPDLDPVKMLVLHRSAPIGTIIKVTNPMTNRSTFAKVVGKFTENESTKDVIIVMTKAVAESIGALDKRFFCNLTYSGQEVEQ
jgi:peptidoglycan endopeptidase LytF